MIGEQGPIEEHHPGERERQLLAHDHPARRDSLEVFPMGLGIVRKCKLVSRPGQHPQVDRVNEQLARRSPPRTSLSSPLTPPCRNCSESPGAIQSAGSTPLRGVAGVREPVVLRFPLANPLVLPELELQRLIAGRGPRAAA